MVENNIQTALILGPNIDMELDIKQILCRVQYRLTFDLLFLCRSHSEPSEHGLSTLLQILRLTENDPDESHLEQLRNTKRDFLARSTAVYRSVDPRGGIENGYALSLRMAERLQKMDNSKEGVDFALRSTAVNQEFNLWSVSPPAITDSGACQYLKTSVLAAMSLRSDNPHDHPPYIDLQ
ncbi:hypothetical protein LPJ66_004049 [Kickxella alabastrina]|uniref:Uncharacterized protein n=1 Tax=Kickxella alabastrina TaxID=61397 RepID=A0ACC1IM35_9FUNG|nr:hypothetical protein LPJ66_004049 [Kickxella alabastrina]